MQVVVGDSENSRQKSRNAMEINGQKKPLKHVLPHRKQRVLRKRASSLSCEESPTISVLETDTKAHFFKFSSASQQSHRPVPESLSFLSESDSESQSDSPIHRYHDLSSPITCMHPRWKCQGYQSEGSPAPMHTVPRLLPPIGVFWDIENCQVPKGRSAVAVAQVIRKRFFAGYREAEFLVVCDVKKESNQILQELNDAQVNLIHVASMCKNAADEKLRQSMRRFADIHGSPACIILISGDINFAADITDLRHRKKINVVLLHMENTSENLILCASEHYSFSELVETLPPRGAMKQSNQPVEVIVYNLPAEKDSGSVKNRLRQLSDNCGGRVTALKQTCATIRFTSFDIASRAQKRMDGEDVFGRKIQVSQPVRISENNSFSLGRKYLGNGMRDNAAGWNDVSLRTSSIPHCVPNAFNFLGASAKQYPYLGNWSVYGSSSTSLNVAQEYLCTGIHTPPVDIFASSRNNSPFSAFQGQCLPGLISRISPAEESVNIPFNTVDRTIMGPRKIRGMQKDASVDMEAFQPSVNNVQIGSHSARALVKTSTSDVLSQGRKITNRMSPSLAIPSEKSKSPKRRSSKGRMGSQSRTSTPALQQYDGDLDEPEHFFHPINSSEAPPSSSSSSNGPVKLHVSNLDPSFGAREMKRILLNAFKEHVVVLHLLVLTRPDGCLNAVVCLASQQDAQYAIYKLQRCKIGHKRINISHASASGPSPQLIRSQVISLLQDVPDHKLPLFKFCELYESRFLCSISRSDICKVEECVVTDGPRGRIVSLLIDPRNSPSPQMQGVQEMEDIEPPFCPIHGHEIQPNRGWAEQETLSLPLVNISLTLLATRVHTLLHTHNGSLHLASLPQCYQAQFEALQEDKDGVALEHLLSCLPGVDIYVSHSNIKYLQWSKTHSVSSSSSKTDEETSKNSSLPGQIPGFSREVVELLKTSPQCQLLFDKFIPAYHHHFGKQCRVADYGFTKLIELLESLPQTVQVLGEGNHRVITLSHRVQLRRFTGDLIRILRAQPNKQVLLSHLPNAFEQVFNKPLIVSSYGVCDISDLLSDVSDKSLMVMPVDGAEGDMLIAIPKREQTPEEIKRTKEFADEVLELLRHAPNCSMRFNKFIPAHHIHFGRQCRVSDYGFTKLIELFEALPEIVKIVNEREERWISLTKKEHLKVLADQITSLLQSAPDYTLSIATLNNNFRMQFGYSLHPNSFDCSTVEELLALLPHIIQVLPSASGLRVTLKNNTSTKNIHSILMAERNCSMDFTDLLNKYKELFNQILSMDEVMKMKEIKVTEISGKFLVQLQLSYVKQHVIREIQDLVIDAGGSLLLSSVESKYLERYGRPCQPSQFGFSSLGAFLQTSHGAIRLRGRGARRLLQLSDTGVSAAPCMDSTDISMNTTSGVESVSPNAPLNNIVSVAPSITVSDQRGDSSSTNDGDSGHDDGSSTSAVDVDSSLSSGSKVQYSERSSTSDVLSDVGTSVNGFDPVGHFKNRTPGKAYGRDFHCDVSPVWCADSPPSFTPYKGPWSQRILPQLNETDSPAHMLSPSSNLLPAFSAEGSTTSNLVVCHLPPLYSYPPFLPGYVGSPEPNTLPLPHLSLAAPLLLQAQNTAQQSSLHGNSNSSTPSRTKVKRRLAAQFQTPLDLP